MPLLSPAASLPTTKQTYLFSRFLCVKEPPQREQELEGNLRVARLVRPQVMQGADIRGREIK